MKKKSRADSQWAKWDKKYIWHPFTQHAIWEKESNLIIESGKNEYLRDINGRTFLDGVSSLWLNLQGHNNPVLNKAIINQLKKISHSTFLGLSHVPAIELAKLLADISPPGLVRSFYSDNGATSVEIALKMAFQYWAQHPNGRQIRPEFIALEGSYHGDTLGSVSVGGIQTFHSKFKPLLFKTHFSMAPDCYRCPFNKKKASDRFRNGERIKTVPRPGQKRPETGCRWECLGRFESILKKRKKHLSAAIVEPVVQGAVGINVQPPGFTAGVERLCRKYGILLIVDEVATGFGRTGTLFASEQENIRPDFMCLAKSITGGYSPLAVTMTTERIFKAFKGPVQQKTFFHGHSYTAHPLGAAVAIANIRRIRDIKLLEKSRQKAHLLRRELQPLARLPHVGSIRQAGLMIGVELVQDKGAKRPYPAQNRMGAKICKKLLSHGFWLRPLGDVIVIMPPLTTPKKELRRLARALSDVIIRELKT